MSDWKDLGTLLREYGLISAADLQEGLDLHQKSGLRLGEALVQLGKISMEDVDWVLSKQLNIPFVIVEDVTPNVELLGRLGKTFLIENRILPLYETEDQIAVAMEDPFNKEALHHLKETTGKEVIISTGSGRRIKEILRKTMIKEGLPQLIATVKNITEKIMDTSFYRIDFISSGHSCTVNIYGLGILRRVLTTEGPFVKDDIFRAFENLDIPFLFEESGDDRKFFLSVYPLVNRTDTMDLPSIVGCYGLYCPDGPVFTDACFRGVQGLRHSSTPFHGYPYISAKKASPRYKKTIYIADAAPDEFKNYYLNMRIPVRCGVCSGDGCRTCDDLGYLFEKMEGIYSSDDLNDKLKETAHGKD